MVLGFSFYCYSSEFIVCIETIVVEDSILNAWSFVGLLQSFVGLGDGAQGAPSTGPWPAYGAGGPLGDIPGARPPQWSGHL